MAQAVIGALRVNLGLDSAQFQSGLNRSKSGMDKFAKAAAIGFAAVSAAATGAFLAIQGAAQRADDAWKASQSLGVPIEEMGRLQHAAEMSGASFSSLERTLRRTGQAITKSMEGSADASTRAFDAIGVALVNVDGSARAAHDVLADVADQFQSMPDGAQKTALAYDMFGRTGTELIPMLNAGREGLAAMGDEAERLGLVFDERTGRAAEAFNDNMARLGATMTGLWNNVLAQTIGGFAQLTDKIVAATQEGGGFDIVARGISGAMNILVRAITLVVDNLSFLIDVFKIFVAMKVVLFLGSLAGGMITVARSIRNVGVVMTLVTKITRAKITAVLLLAAAVAKLTGTYDAMVGWVQDFGRAIHDALPSSIRDGIDGLGASLDALTGGFDAFESEANSDLATFQAGADLAANSIGSVGSAAQSTADQVNTAGGVLERFGDIGERVSSTLADGFADMFIHVLEGGKNLGSMLADLGKQIGRMFLQQGFQILFGLGGGGLGGLFSGIANFFGGARANGGPVAAGRSYLVGEKGPELFTPGAGGQITSNARLRDARPTQVYLVVEEGSMFEARVQSIAGQGDVQVMKSVERSLPSMLSDMQMRQG